MTADPAVEVSGLARRFGELWAVRDVSLRIAPGELFGVLGPNGAGKSTTIRMLCGILAPTAGGGRVLGHDLLSDGEAVKAGIGYMTQAFSLYADLSVEENLRFYAGIHALPFFGRSPRIEAQLARFALADRRRQVVGTLSGGYRQRVALACATVHDPRLLVLDEPTAGVDPVSRREFWQLVGALARAGTAILATTHYMDEAERFDRLAFIFRGRLIGTGTPAELVAAAGLAVAEGEIDDAPAVAGRLAADPRVVEAAVHGRGLRVVARDPAAIPPGLLPVRATVEDAFVALTREGG
jgi:ABC-2 type transport system ATP-binding protein